MSDHGSVSTDARTPGAIRAVLTETRDSLRSVFGNPHLKRLQLAYVGSLVGDLVYATAVSVWAYTVGGTTLVGIWLAVRLAVLMVMSPIMAGLADKYPKKVLLLTADLSRAVIVAAMTVTMLAHQTVLTLVLGALVTILGGVFRPAQMSWTPALARTPAELTASNGTSSTFESLGFFVGPALGGLLITLWNVEVALAFNVVTFLWSAALIVGIRHSSTVVPEEDEEDAPASSRLKEMSKGFSTVAANADLRRIAIMTGLQTVIAGASGVFIIVLAVDLLRTGPAGIGVIDSISGLFAVVGGLAVIGRAGRNTLAGDLVRGVTMWSLPLLFVAVWPSKVTVIVLAAFIGFANPFVDVGYYTLIQRLTPPKVLGRTLGALEAVVVAGMVAGALLTPYLLDTVKLRWTMAILALIIGIPAMLSVGWARRLDASLRTPEFADLLRGISLFQPLSQPSLERVAQAATRQTVPAGTVILREGDASDEFFIIEAGAVEVTHDGHVLRQEGPGDFFGEIGLLRDVPRTATVTATAETQLVVLEREHFLEAVRGSDESVAMVDSVVRARLEIT